MVMGKKIDRSVLLKAVKLIKVWHDMGDTNPHPDIFRIYYNCSPEMLPIREALGSYDQIKNEVISASSISKKSEA